MTTNEEPPDSSPNIYLEQLRLAQQVIHAVLSHEDERASLDKLVIELSQHPKSRLKERPAIHNPWTKCMLQSTNRKLHDLPYNAYGIAQTVSLAEYMMDIIFPLVSLQYETTHEKKPLKITPSISQDREVFISS